VNVPDVRSRVAAIELLLREGLGRPPQAEEPAAPRLPENVDTVRNMNWDELQVLFANTYVDEIAAVVNGEGRQMLRDRLEHLTDDERRVLREELAGISA